MLLAPRKTNRKTNVSGSLTEGWYNIERTVQVVLSPKKDLKGNLMSGKPLQLWRSIAF